MAKPRRADAHRHSVGAKISDSVLAALDVYVARHKLPNRSAAIRQAIYEMLNEPGVIREIKVRRVVAP